EDQIHRVDRLSAGHTSSRTISQPYFCLLGIRVDGNNIEPFETLEPRLDRWRIDRLRVAKTISGNEVGSPQIAWHQIGMTTIETVDQDGGTGDRSIPSVADAKLHQIAARDFRREVTGQVMTRQRAKRHGLIEAGVGTVPHPRLVEPAAGPHVPRVQAGS